MAEVEMSRTIGHLARRAGRNRVGRQPPVLAAVPVPRGCPKPDVFTKWIDARPGLRDLLGPRADAAQVPALRSAIAHRPAA
jgi:hypothetical protein